MALDGYVTDRLSFRWESWNDLRGRIGPLWLQHNAEIASPGDQPLFDPDWELFDEMAARNCDHWIAAYADQQLVGYVFCIVKGHLHRKSTLSGFWDLYWLQPQWRRRWNGYQLIKAGRDSLWARGVRKQYIGTKMWKDIGPILRRLGFVETERLFTLSLDN